MAYLLNELGESFNWAKHIAVQEWWNFILFLVGAILIHLWCPQKTLFFLFWYLTMS